MNALPCYADVSASQHARILGDLDRHADLIDERAKEIDANPSHVAELFLDDAVFLERTGKGNGHIELIALAITAMDAWPVIEKKIAGLSTTADEDRLLPILFRQLRPLWERRAVLVREAAEDELKREDA